MQDYISQLSVPNEHLRT